MNTEKQLQLVSFEQAKRLKELGFDWKTYRTYKFNGEAAVPISEQNYNKLDNRISAPTIALALKWFRDEKDLLSDVCLIITSRYSYSIIKNDGEDFIISIDNNDNTNYPTYEAAESALLDVLLTLLEKEK